MIQTFYSNNKPFLINSEPESYYTYVDRSSDGKKYYYRIENSQIPLVKRISKLVLVLLKTIFTGGINFYFSDYTRSQWREFLENKREIILLKQEPFDPLTLPIGFSQESLRTFLIQTLRNSIIFQDNYYQLHIREQHLQAFPEDLDQLSHLQILFLWNTNLSSLPETIGRLSNLESFFLAGNQLHTLPDSIAQLSNLRMLNLYNNRFQTIPDCLYRLPQTCVVVLQQNPLNREAIEQAKARMQALDYQGPQFCFSESQS